MLASLRDVDRARLVQVSTWLPMEVGPFTPRLRFDGNLPQDVAVQSWIFKLANRSSR